MTLSTCNRNDAQVLRVTNLDDFGPGSFRQALADVENDRFNVVVFQVAGVIRLSNRIDFSKQCLYIAGQTAPGSGITISGDLFWRSTARNVVMRYVRMANGSNHLIMASNGDFIIDHVSSRWASNSLITVTKYEETWSRPVKNVTIQRSIFSEALARHPVANIVSAADRWRPSNKIWNVDLHHNLYANNSHRNPLIHIGGAKVVNNVVYNWNQGALEGSERAVTDIIANYYKKGPRTYMKSLDWEITYICNDRRRRPADFEGFASYYVVGNIGPHNSDPNADNWSGPSRMVACYYTTGPGQVIGVEVPAGLMERRTTPLPDPAHDYPIETETATAAYASIVTGGEVGANARVDCSGDWIANSDAVDQRVINDARNGTGPTFIPTSPTDVGGWPQVTPGTACRNLAGDGIPDAYKLRYGLDVNAWYANVNLNGDGYTVLEAFLNGTSPR